MLYILVFGNWRRQLLKPIILVKVGFGFCKIAIFLFLTIAISCSSKNEISRWWDFRFGNLRLFTEEGWRDVERFIVIFAGWDSLPISFSLFESWITLQLGLIWKSHLIWPTESCFMPTFRKGWTYAILLIQDALMLSFICIY